MFPETLIISINTHGIIPTKSENNISKPIFQKMKYPINMFKINATAYGIPFLSSLDNTQNLISNLKHTVNKLPIEIITPDTISDIIKKQCTELNNLNNKNIVKCFNKPEYSNKSEYLNLYANYTDFMFRTIKTKPNEKYIEKFFVRFETNEVNMIKQSDKSYEYFDDIRLLNFDNISLFKLLDEFKFKHDRSYIALTEIIDFLYNMTNMKNLIILDLTCSNTEDNKRNDCRIRRELIKDKLY